MHTQQYDYIVKEVLNYTFTYTLKSQQSIWITNIIVIFIS